MRTLEHVDVGLGVLGHALQRLIEDVGVEVDLLAGLVALHVVERLLVPLGRLFLAPELLEVAEEADHALLRLDLRGVDVPEHRAGGVDVLGPECVLIGLVEFDCFDFDFQIVKVAVVNVVVERLALGTDTFVELFQVVFEVFVVEVSHGA